MGTVVPIRLRNWTSQSFVDAFDSWIEPSKERPKGQTRYNDEFKQEAIRQTMDKRHPVAKVAERLRVSCYSLYDWMKLPEDCLSLERALGRVFSRL